MLVQSQGLSHIFIRKFSLSTWSGGRVCYGGGDAGWPSALLPNLITSVATTNRLALLPHTTITTVENEPPKTDMKCSSQYCTGLHTTQPYLAGYSTDNSTEHGTDCSTDYSTHCSTQNSTY